MEKLMQKELVNGLKEIFEHQLRYIILYGSVARGTDTEESDIDIAILLESSYSSRQKEALIDFTVDMDLKYDKVVSVVDINYEDYMKWKETLPFYRNVAKDGVVLWSAE